MVDPLYVGSAHNPAIPTMSSTSNNRVHLTGANLTVDDVNQAYDNDQFYLTDQADCLAAVPKVASNTAVRVVTSTLAAGQTTVRLGVDARDVSQSFCRSFARFGDYRLCGRWNDVMTWVDLGSVTLLRCVKSPTPTCVNPILVVLIW